MSQSEQYLSTSEGSSELILFTADASMRNLPTHVTRHGGETWKLHVILSSNPHSVLLSPDGIFYGRAEVENYLKSIRGEPTLIRF